MALTRMTMEEVKARAARRTPEGQAEFKRRMAETTEEDVRRHMTEDGEDPDAPLPPFQPPPDAKAIRAKLGMSQVVFAALLGIPVAMLRNWEQDRVVMDPAARSLLKVVDREPEAVLRALAPAPSAAG
ncbi:MAG TPA: helix-turn-helix domain-containing protein [Acetobacteraceae bacterium]|nr:helix-turn-helix domain-containing protein [Acetobacteraceae bacterium]